MKTISEQLKDLKLRHGDLCEIKGYEGRAVVLLDLNLKELYARRDDRIFCTGDLGSTVTCGWKANKADVLGPKIIGITYLQVLPAPSPKPLPEAVENVVNSLGFLTGAKKEMRDFARAILAEAAKVKTGEV